MTVLPLFLAASLCQATVQPPQAVERSFFLMGTSLDVSIEAASRRAALNASDRVFRTVRDDERRLSTWKPATELSRVNQAPVGKEIALSPLLERDLRTAYRYAVETSFAFTPWIGSLVRAWGVRTGGRIPSIAERTRAREAARPGAFSWVARGGHFRLVKEDKDARIEEGGFGKGIALDDAVATLRDAGIRSAVLDFGGQVSVLGSGPVPIEVADPAARDRVLVEFRQGEGSIATSGNSEHGMTVRTSSGVRRIGHLLDPRTGLPAPYDGSITIIAPTGVAADCLSKIFVMGATDGLRWADQHRVEALWIIPALGQPGRWIAEASCAWKPSLKALSTDVEIRSRCHEPNQNPSRKG